eukprot:GHVP01064978.1.p1 GENE.GHVP01064978.1~~GHVP01064978.1.p1  ORF type:complete len:1016 (+),score=163.30 GHVP01064978.1:2885-5932(+)
MSLRNSEDLHGILAFILDRTSVKAENPPDFCAVLTEYPNALAFANQNLSFYFIHLSLEFGKEVVFNKILDFLFYDRASDDGLIQSSSLEEVYSRRSYIIYEYIVAQLGQGASRFCASNRPTSCFGLFFRQHDKDAVKLPTNLGTTNTFELEILKENSRFIEYGSISFKPQDLLTLEWKISTTRERSTKEMLILCDMLMYRYYTSLRTNIVCRILRVLSYPKNRRYAPSKYLMESAQFLFRNKGFYQKDKYSRIRKSIDTDTLTEKNKLPDVSPKNFSILYSRILILSFSENIALTAAICEILHAPFYLLQNLSLPGVEDVLLQFLGSCHSTSPPIHERMLSYLHSSGWIDFVVSIFKPKAYEKRVQYLLTPHPSTTRNVKTRRKRLKKRRCMSDCPLEHRQIVARWASKPEVPQRSSSWSPTRRMNSYLQVRTKYRRLRQSYAGSSSDGQSFPTTRQFPSIFRTKNFVENSIHGMKLLDTSWSEEFSSLTNGEESNQTVASCTHSGSMSNCVSPVTPIVEVVTPRSECSLENKDETISREPDSDNHDSPSEPSKRSYWMMDSKIRPTDSERSSILKRTRVYDVVNFLCRLLEGSNKIQPDQLEPTTFGEFVNRIKIPQDHCHSYKKVLHFDEKNFRDAILNVSQGYLNTAEKINADGLRNSRLIQCVQPHYEFLNLLFVESKLCLSLTDAIHKGINFEASLLLLQTIVKSALPGQCLSYFADSISQQLAQCFVSLANQTATRLENFLPLTFREKTGLPNSGTYEGNSLLQTTASSEGSVIGSNKATDRTSTRFVVTSGNCTLSRSGIDITTLGLVSLMASATKIQTEHQIFTKEPMRFWKILTGCFLTQRNNIFLTKCGQIIEKGLQSEDLNLRLSITTDTFLVEGLCERIKEGSRDGLPFVEFVAKALEAAALDSGQRCKTAEEKRDLEETKKDLEASYIGMSLSNETPTTKILTYLTKDKWEEWKYLCVFLDAKKQHQKPDLSTIMSIEEACKIRAARRAEQRIRRVDELMDF